MSEHDDYTADLPEDAGADTATLTDTPDPWAFDTDGDGRVDVVQWEFGDGTWQELSDVDGDGKADVLMIDTDGDDTANYQIWDNGDGTYTVAQDADGDGEFESQQSFTRDELDASLPGVGDLLDSTFDAVDDGSSDPDGPATPDTTDGSPQGYDTDGDGAVDSVEWDFGDGTWQVLADVDGDGDADVLMIDTDGDDSANYQIWDNGDGTYTVLGDSDNDGTFEAEQTFTRAELDDALPGVGELLDSQISGDATDGPTDDPQPTGDTTDDGGVITDYDGDGQADTVHWDFGDGTWQELVDVDGDGNADVLLIDTDGDDAANYAIADNGDGTYTIYTDADNDGQWDDDAQTIGRADLDSSLPGVADLLDSRIVGDAGTDDPATPADPGATGDTTDDGAVPLDYDGDGVVDTLQWNFGDGTWQELRDLDGDGDADVLLIDTDGDDVANYAISDNGDGTYTVYSDADNDGQWDDDSQTLSRADLDSNLPGVADLLDTRIDQEAGEAGGDTPSGDEPGILGTADDGALIVDADGDGQADTLHWDFGDGTWQELVDVDGDNEADVLLIDTDGDDMANYAIADNGDGTYTVYADADNDGEWDDDPRTFSHDELETALPGVTDVLDGQITAGGTTPTDPQPADPTDPTADPASDPTSPVDPSEVDVQAADTDGDGRTDVIQWSFPDGTWQQLIDVDGNGSADVLVIDVDGDDRPDVQIWGNGDGTYTAAQDADGDGEYESQQTFTRAELDEAIPGVADLLDSPMADIEAGAGTAQPDPGQPTDDPVDPNADATPVAGTGDNPVTDGSWTAEDTDGDGVVDVEAWSFADGTWQVLVDVDGNGSPDVLAIDTDGDETENIQVWGNPDGTYTVLYDADGDGEFEVTNTFDRAELDARLPGAADLLDTSYDSQPPTDGPPTDAPAPTDAPTDQPVTADLPPVPAGSQGSTAGS